MFKGRIIIIGAGIGGLTLANLLLRQGIDTLVCEQSSSLSEVGAGIQLSPNAIKVLRVLGLENRLRATAFAPEAFTGWDWRSGRQIYRTPIHPLYETRYGAPYLHVHRADLQHALAAQLPSTTLKLGTRLTGLRQEAGRVYLDFHDTEPLEADLVVGADGIHSVVRAALFGDAKARFTGNMCWRGVVRTAMLPPDLIPPTASNWLGPHGHVVHYYLRGGELVNFVAVREIAQWSAESWTTRSSRAVLLQAFSGWHPRVRTLFGQADKLYEWGLFDRDPLSQWSRDRVTLLGDAAHPMLPFLAQGAAQAMEDAYALADWLRIQGDDPALTLRLYQDERSARTSRIQLGARARGHSIHLASSLARWRRNLRFRWRGLRDPNGTSHQAEWIYEHDVTQLNREGPVRNNGTVNFTQ